MKTTLPVGLDPKTHPETIKFLKYVERQLKKGLVDIKFCLADEGLEGATLESVFKEANRMLRAKKGKPDPDFF